MRISKVAYCELRSGGNFSHQAVEMEAMLDPLDILGEVVDALRRNVRDELEPDPGAAEPPVPNEQLRDIADEIMQALDHSMPKAVHELEKLADRLGWTPF